MVGGVCATKNESWVSGEVSHIVAYCKDRRYEIIIDTSDLDFVSSISGAWYVIHNNRNRLYVRAETGGAPLTLSRFILGLTPSSRNVRFKNRNHLDFRRSNLLEYTRDSDPIPRLMSFVEESDSGCWLWTGNLFDSGYGCFVLNGKTMRAHRASYELLVGPIPNGLVLDHKCMTKRCVNPSHLEPVTTAENVRRALAYVESLRNGHCCNGHLLTPETTRLAGGRTGAKLKCKLCDAMYSERHYRKLTGAS